MSLIKYLKYKVCNKFFVAVFSKKTSSLLRSTDGNHNVSTSFFFNFLDDTTHLGDRLFFLPLIKTMIENEYVVKIAYEDSISSVFLRKIIGVMPIFTSLPDESDCVIFPAPSFMNFKNRFKAPTLVDFTDDSCGCKITDQLVDSMNQEMKLSISCLNFEPLMKTEKIANPIGLEDNEKYYLFSNYIESGRFRKYFINEKRLFNCAAHLRRDGYKIIHVGSKQDVDRDRRIYPFVDIDLRGKTSLSDMIDIVQYGNIIGAVTYDNFLMHLVGMYHKVAYVLFRGRFFKKNCEHHLRFVNNTFFADESCLTYL